MNTLSNKCTHCKTNPVSTTLYILNKRVALCKTCVEEKSLREIISGKNKE